ncbi:epithelial discoidin domain-containing receptor 1 isoform X1 [Lates japonicus]|uniref:Epithelial discoidin domain-containing receptor 1 isoform X1 n=1 Tax=Lates japonicus TaxID=270547 RepID=A0AAD3N1M6_LATJO|nr:epithelial discoidin domain-containing receptor 1 isoform X1 [Lates japonicus]
MLPHIKGKYACGHQCVTGQVTMCVAAVMALPLLRLFPVTVVTVLVALVSSSEEQWHFNPAQCRSPLGIQEDRFHPELMSCFQAVRLTEAKHGRDTGPPDVLISSRFRLRSPSSGEQDRRHCQCDRVDIVELERGWAIVSWSTFFPSGSEYLGVPPPCPMDTGRSLLRGSRLRYSRRSGVQVMRTPTIFFERFAVTPIRGRMVLLPWLTEFVSVCPDGLKAYTAPVGPRHAPVWPSGMPVYLNDSTYDRALSKAHTLISFLWVLALPPGVRVFSGGMLSLASRQPGPLPPAVLQLGPLRCPSHWGAALRSITAVLLLKPPAMHTFMTVHTGAFWHRVRRQERMN